MKIITSAVISIGIVLVPFYSLLAQAKVKTEKLGDNNSTEEIIVHCTSFKNTRGIIICIFSATENNLNERTAIETKLLSQQLTTRTVEGKFDAKIKFRSLEKGEYKVIALSRNNLALITEPWFFNVRGINDITGTIPEFRIIKIQYDGDIISDQPAKDLKIWWEGVIQFPLHVRFYPVSANAQEPGWQTVTDTIQSNENPIIGKGFLWAIGIKEITTVNYALMLEEVNGRQKTWPVAQSFKILPAKQ